EIDRIAGTPVASARGYLTKDSLAEALDRVLQQAGVEAALGRLEALMRLGFQVARESGGSMGPFFGSELARPPLPDPGDEAAWESYAEEVSARLAGWRDFSGDEMGPVMLAALSGARGITRQLSMIVGPWRTRFWRGETPEMVTFRHGYRDGLTL